MGNVLLVTVGRFQFTMLGRGCERFFVHLLLIAFVAGHVLIIGHVGIPFSVSIPPILLAFPLLIIITFIVCINVFTLNPK